MREETGKLNQIIQIMITYKFKIVFMHYISQYHLKEQLRSAR